MQVGDLAARVLPRRKGGEAGGCCRLVGGELEVEEGQDVHVRVVGAQCHELVGGEVAILVGGARLRKWNASQAAHISACVLPRQGWAGHQIKDRSVDVSSCRDRNQTDIAVLCATFF